MRGFCFLCLWPYFTEHSSPCWNRPYTSTVWTLSSLLSGTDDEACVWSRERGRGWSGRGETRDITQTPPAESANGTVAPFGSCASPIEPAVTLPNGVFQGEAILWSVLHSRSKFVLPQRTLLCEPGFLPSLWFPPQELSWCWVSLWDVASKRLLCANHVRWYPLLRELWRRQLRERVPSQVDLPGQRGGGEETAQDWKRGRSHNCLSFSYTF